MNTILKGCLLTISVLSEFKASWTDTVGPYSSTVDGIVEDIEKCEAIIESTGVQINCHHHSASCARESRGKERATRTTD